MSLINGMKPNTSKIVSDLSRLKKTNASFASLKKIDHPVQNQLKLKQDKKDTLKIQSFVEDPNRSVETCLPELI